MYAFSRFLAALRIRVRLFQIRRLRREIERTSARISARHSCLRSRLIALMSDNAVDYAIYRRQR